jgi:hypothetical protein
VSRRGIGGTGVGITCLVHPVGFQSAGTAGWWRRQLQWAVWVTAAARGWRPVAGLKMGDQSFQPARDGPDQKMGDQSFRRTLEWFLARRGDREEQFKIAEKKIMAQTKFPPEYELPVNMSMVHLQVIRPWIAKRVRSKKKIFFSQSL